MRIARTTFALVASALVLVAGHAFAATGPIPAPITWEREFLPAAVEPGETVTLRFSLTNDHANLLEDGAFSEDLDAILDGLTRVSGTGSFDCGTPAFSGTSDVEVSNLTIASGDTCLIFLVAVVPADATPGTYDGSTASLTSMIGATPYINPPPTEVNELSVVADADRPGTLTKTFSDTTLLPAEYVEITFTLTNNHPVDDYDTLEFSDDLGAMLPDAVVELLPAAGFCNGSGVAAGTDVVTFSNVALDAAGGTCTFSIYVKVPGTAQPGTYQNLTSSVEGIEQTHSTQQRFASPARAELTVLPAVTFTKEFVDNPVAPGQTTELRFTIVNHLPGFIAYVSFQDDLEAVLPGLASISPPSSDMCDALAGVSGTSTVTASGLSADAGGTCTFSVEVLVPLGAAVGTYTNTTTVLNYQTPGSPPATAAAATDDLVVALPTGSITIVKNVTGPNNTFSFDSALLGDFDLTTSAGTASRTFSDLDPGTYVVSELAEANYELISLVCDDGSTTSLGTATATIDLVAFEDVTCTFTNGAESSMTVAVETAGGDGTFSFTGDLAPTFSTTNGFASASYLVSAGGTYSAIAEPNDTFVLAAIACEGDTDSGTIVSLADRSAVFDADPGENIVCTFLFVEVSDRTADIIAAFLARRANALFDAGPSLDHLLDRFGGGTDTTDEPIQALGYFATQVASGEPSEFAAVFGSPNSRFSLWSEARYDRYSAGTPGAAIEGATLLGEVGFDVLATQRLALGVMAAGDWADERSNDLGYAIGGKGFLVGPYFAVKLGERLYFDARVLWGRSYNEVSPFLTYTDEFTTGRVLVAGRLSGEVVLGRFSLRPGTEIAWLREWQHAYTDSNSILIPEQIVSLGRVTFGPEMALTISTERGFTIRPMLALNGIWTFTTGELRARVEGGIGIETADGTRFDVTGGYDGIGDAAFSAWFARGGVTVPLP